MKDLLDKRLMCRTDQRDRLLVEYKASLIVFEAVPHTLHSASDFF